MPARLVVTENITVDGVVEMLTDWFAPDAEVDPEHAAVSARQMGTEQAVLLGRRTFEDFRGYWPLQTDDTTGVTEHFNRVVKYVVTRAGLPDPGWERTTVLTGSLVEQVGRLKEIGDGELVVTGSISLVHDLIDAGLVDEFRLFTYPVVVGRGRRLFRDGVIPPQLQLREAQAFGSGVLLVTYTVTG